MPNTLFAILLGGIALYAVFAATRSASQVRIGWIVVAFFAAIQVWNLLSAYSMWLAILTTLGIVGGFLFTRRAPAAGGV